MFCIIVFCGFKFKPQTQPTLKFNPQKHAFCLAIELRLDQLFAIYVKFNYEQMYIFSYTIKIIVKKGDEDIYLFR